ncbi:MAG TPA: LysR family transcriptional regulator [Deltaproteobacteria bacterium]|nr:LysR family transcriptional regulator [Deltaproteobacteria bacterium]
MDIESLKIFCDVITLKGFTQAAVANSITQSAVSQRLKALEKKLGFILIERRGNELSLTRAGELTYQGARRILADLRELEDQLKEIGGQVSGSVKVATIYSVGLYELNPSVKKFLRNHPDIDVQIEYSRANKIYQDVVNGSVDLGIVAYPANKPQIRSVPFLQDELVLICSPDHPFSSSESISLQKLASQPFVTFQHDIPTRKALDEILKKNGVAVIIKAEFENIELIKRAVEIGLGISIVPSMTVRSEVQAGLLRAISFAEGPFTRPIAVLYRRGRSLPPAVRKFIAVLTEEETQFLENKS